MSIFTADSLLWMKLQISPKKNIWELFMLDKTMEIGKHILYTHKNIFSRTYKQMRGIPCFTVKALNILECNLLIEKSPDLEENYRT